MIDPHPQLVLLQSAQANLDYWQQCEDIAGDAKLVPVENTIGMPCLPNPKQQKLKTTSAMLPGISNRQVIGSVMPGR